MKPCDKLDIAILDALQADARLTNQRLAEKVGLSPSPCWRRVKQLEKRGIVRRYATLLEPAEVGLQVLAYLSVSLEDHHPDTVAEFDRLVQRLPEVMECYSMSGQYDFLLRVVSSSMAAYEEFLNHHLLRLKGVHTANTSFVLKQKKHTTALPLGAMLKDN